MKRAARARRAAKILRRILTILVVTVFTLWAISAAAVLIWSSRDEARPAQAIVVLGAAQYAGKPSPVLRARLDHALDLWNRHLASLLILTGGTGPGDTTSEAAVGRNYARKHGVPDSAILVENEGRTTSESMRAVAGMLEVRGLQSALLVSDPFHMLRLRILARRFGFTPYTSPTQTSPISPNREARWKYMFSESLKAPLAFFFERKM
ncbi:MAG: YdcF family protein [Gemmatimonadetes bacterium]|nr:MAG: YdcF family protein [Gemmatimonadota bacterium]PYP49435.1 MAG: YdcF family protein [Gemmatimonadota bacterium]